MQLKQAELLRGYQNYQDIKARAVWEMTTFVLSETAMAGIGAALAMRAGKLTAAPAAADASSAASTAAATEATTRGAAFIAARDHAVEVTNKLISQELAAGHIAEEQVARRYGTIADAVFKANVRQAVTEGRLSSTTVTSPTVGLNRGFSRSWYKAVDVWDTATGEGFDLMTANSKYFYRHESKYLAPRVMPDGTVLHEVHGIFYFRF
jgi:hypothetical protein